MCPVKADLWFKYTDFLIINLIWRTAFVLIVFTVLITSSRLCHCCKCTLLCTRTLFPSWNLWWSYHMNGPWVRETQQWTLTLFTSRSTWAAYKYHWSLLAIKNYPMALLTLNALLWVADSYLWYDKSTELYQSSHTWALNGHDNQTWQFTVSKIISVLRLIYMVLCR